MTSEDSVVLAISLYLQLQYPKVIYRWDIGADIKLTMGQAVKVKKLQGEKKGYPDLFIAEPRREYSGLYIEVKKNPNEIYTKKGKFRKSEHIRTQDRYLKELRLRGFKAVFGLGFNHTRKIIDNYLNT